MNKVIEKRMVEIADREIENFAKEWKRNPYLWESETDVHSELYIRIKKSLQKFPLKECRYKGMKNKAEFDWIYCKPKTYIKRANYPDIVIYKYSGKEQNIGDKENDLMLWICEIKYATDWSSSLSSETIKNDIEKLKWFLNTKKGGSKYARYLILRRYVRPSKNVEKVINDIDKRIHLYHYGVDRN